MNSFVLKDVYAENFREWLKIREEMPRPIHQQSANVFVSEATSLLTETAIQKLLGKYAQKAKMEKVTALKLRHSFCRNLVDEGFCVEELQRLARHERIETSELYYL
ncbi:tyrosine-type recombinase/integrase [Gracilibacillus ureilyticus]|uniref:tyrosine-type recombinase/integrase n=1 Tax=Gracilibacillus ureilyticus TaxID=531814 RepID=UPI001FDF0488